MKVQKIVLTEQDIDFMTCGCGARRDIDKEADKVSIFLPEANCFDAIKIEVINCFVKKLKEEKFNGYATLEDYFEDSIECVSVEDIDNIAEKLKKEL